VNIYEYTFVSPCFMVGLPVVQIMIAAYERLEYFKLCFKSAYNQSYEFWGAHSEKILHFRVSSRFIKYNH